jgi:hypothetical protein|tara:strand:+ start:174 stop:503 length:330 start_codon:yes stop_codon:yes gene_type:complete
MRNIICLIGIVTLAGCSATHQETMLDPAQYCNTTSKYELNNKTTVNSNTIVECTDKPKVEHFVKATGMARKCRPYQTVVNIRGNQKNVQGFLCQFPNGEWQAVDSRYRY